jgi:type II secretory pathway component PulF
MTMNSGVAALITYRYRSASSDGVTHAGEIVATSVESAVLAIRAQGVWPLEVVAASSRVAASRPMPVRELGVGFRVLATILEARVPPGSVMRVAATSLPPVWQRCVPAMTAALESGESFSTSFRSAGVNVPAVVDGLLRAGEAAGDLAGALRRAAELTEKSAATRSAIIDALAYPALLLTAGVGVIGLLVTVVIPRFTEVLTNLGQELPASTRIVLMLASAVRVGLIPVVVSATVLFAAFARWRHTRSGVLQWHRFLLSLPVLGDLRFSYATARVADAWAALLDCGMPVARALPFAAASSGDAALEARLLAARQRIVEGEPIARALEATRAMTPGATRLIGAGEAGGALSALLKHAALLEGARASVRTKSLLKVIEPVLILILGAIVSGVAVALLQAVYSVRVDKL